MKTNEFDAEMNHHVSTTSMRKDDNGAIAQQAVDSDYGRRIEFDHSWTVYHVFSGEPACIDGVVLTGLPRLSATSKMLRLNRETVLRKRRRQSLLSL